MADLNIRIWGTFVDQEGVTQMVDATYENVNGLFASTFKWDGEKCEQNTATVGTIASKNWAKMMEFMGQEAGKETFMKAIIYAMGKLGIASD